MQNLKNKSHTLTHTRAHTYAQLSFGKSVKYVCVSHLPNPSHVQIHLSGRGAASSSRRLAFWPGPVASWEEIKWSRVETRCFSPGTSFAKPLVVFPPWCVSRPYPPLTVVRLLVSWPHLSSWTPRNALLGVTSTQPRVKSRPPSASDHPGLLQTGGSLSAHRRSAWEASVEMS